MGDWKKWLVALVLLVVIVIVYAPVRGFDFVRYEDPSCVSENAIIRAGPSWSGIRSAFTSTFVGSWQPLAALSHMVDCQMLGFHPGRHHLMNLFLHALNVLLLFILLNQLTGSTWRSGFAAALFALHPLNVETVAWIAQRANLLCAFFELLAIWCYAEYARRPSLARYLLTMLGMACALMSSLMAVTLPLVLLLLDGWPLRRATSWSKVGSLVVEKIPMAVLAFFFGLVAFTVQSPAGAMHPAVPNLLFDRLSISVAHYALYIDKMIGPSGLAVLYPPFAGAVSLRILLIYLALLVFVTVVVLRRCAFFPYLSVGWFWYLITLFPVIGIFPAVNYGMADRLTYIPLIGIFILLSWEIAQIADEFPRFRPCLVGASIGVLIALAAGTHIQLQYWRDGLALFDRAISVTSGNYIMHELLGRELADRGRLDESIGEFAKSIRINDRYLPARRNLTVALYQKGDRQQAIALQRETVMAFPHDPQLHCDLAIMLSDAGRKGDAKAQFMETLWLDPTLARAYFGLALLLLEQGKLEDAYPHLQAAVQFSPDWTQANNLLEDVSRKLSKPAKKTPPSSK
jgi:protein O-mannosyl-transferase